MLYLQLNQYMFLNNMIPILSFLGVGKSSVIHSIVNQEVLYNAACTIGCNAQVMVCYWYTVRKSDIFSSFLVFAKKYFLNLFQAKTNASWFRRISLWLSERFCNFNTIRKSAQLLLSVAQKYFCRDGTRSVL